MNKKGFTLIETIIVVAIVCVIGVSSLGFYNNYFNRLDDATQFIEMKINATRNYGLSMSDVMPTIDGVKSRPFIKFEKDKLVVVTGSGTNLKTMTIPYSKLGSNLIEVSTTISDNTIYFNDNGIAVDENGNKYPRIHVYVTKNGGGHSNTYTINIDCLGKISVVKMKDISDTSCSVVATSPEEEIENNRHECPSGFQWNPSIGSCDIICDKASYELENGNCAKKCPANSAHKYENFDICVCNTGYEPWNCACVPKCKENEIRNNSGVCVNSSSAFQAGQIYDITNLPKNIRAIKFKIWGAGGGYGGSDSSHGGNGAGGGYVEGEINVKSTDKVQILIGSSGNNGQFNVGSGAGASPGRFGGGGAGGGTGGHGSSGAGGSGGGASWLKINNTYVAVAGGGGGGGGGSNRVIGLDAGTCFTSAHNASELKGVTCPSDGGGGGGGGGSIPFGGKGGRNGYDYDYGDGHSAGAGCNGINKLSSSVKNGISYTSYNYKAANVYDSKRNGAGQGGINSSYKSATNGLVILTYVTGESGNEVC